MFYYSRRKTNVGKSRKYFLENKTNAHKLFSSKIFSKVQTNTGLLYMIYMIIIGSLIFYIHVNVSVFLLVSIDVIYKFFFFKNYSIFVYLFQKKLKIVFITCVQKSQLSYIEKRMELPFFFISMDSYNFTIEYPFLTNFRSELE